MDHKIKIIACDLDGTLLLNGAQALQSNTCELIRGLRDELGIRFFAASGRQYANLRKLFAPIKDEIGYLCENGCLCYYHGTRILKERMDHNLGQDIIKAILASDDAEVLLSGEKVHYIQPKDMSYYYHMIETVKNDIEIVPDILSTPEEYMKVSVYQKGGVKDLAYWEAMFGSRCTVVTGGNEWLDMMPSGVNKGTALAHILSFLDIAPEECMAIGDNDNDREMLELAEFPVSVKSAKPQIRAMAKYTTDMVEHLFEDMLNGKIEF